MKLFKCTNCAHPIYFENTYCLQCQFSLGFVPGLLQHVALSPAPNGMFAAVGIESHTLYRYCANFHYNVCNWLVEHENPSLFCRACELNRTIPSLARPEYAQRWRKIEIAKHRLLYQLLNMNLPIQSKHQDGWTGLVFDFMSQEHHHSQERIMTGHDNGVITINISEADDIEREMARKRMDEVYRTLLGHFRHEIGHYYWERLIGPSYKLNAFRNLFGDERMPYGEALERYYASRAPVNWSFQYISAYATAHPWEDWAETWAHYLHIIDTLETAYSFGLSVNPTEVSSSSALSASIRTNPYNLTDFEAILKLWLPLTFALNSLNRSMGLQDPYPFFITKPVEEKLKFIHDVVMEASGKIVMEGSIQRE